MFNFTYKNSVPFVLPSKKKKKKKGGGIVPISFMLGCRIGLACKYKRKLVIFNYWYFSRCNLDLCYFSFQLLEI